MDVLISIVGVQQLDGDSDTIELTTDGTLEPTADGYRLRYEETSVTGLEGAMTTLHLAPGQVMLERSGSLTSLLVLEKGKRHLCHYDTGFGSLMVGVFAQSIHSDLTDSGGTLDVSYSLDINSGLNSMNSIFVDVKRNAKKS